MIVLIQLHGLPLQLKQAVSRLNKRDRRELHLYLIRLQHSTPEWKRARP